MRPLTLAVVALAAGLAPGPARADDDTKVLYTAEGRRARLAVEERDTGLVVYRRLVMNGVLHGAQAVRLRNHWLDDLQCLTAARPLDGLAALGALHAFDLKQEPLSYHHRTGPVGAVYHELRTRKGGADANAPVAVIGLTAGTQAAYARRGQAITFYEGDPAVARLVAETDKYFTYVADARRRGATVDVRVGPPRAKLKADAGRKYAAVFVDPSDSFPVPSDLFTTEAVGEYFDRLAPDGLLALHISNKDLNLEPMVARIAHERGLAARVWHDDGEGRPGKTASSWVVLARSREHLGARIASPVGDLVGEFWPGAPLVRVAKDRYPEVGPLLEKNPTRQDGALLAYLDGRGGDAQARWLARLVARHGASARLAAVLEAETGTKFRPPELVQGVPAWTDARADVTVLAWDPAVRSLRRMFGFPTPLDR